MINVIINGNREKIKQMSILEYLETKKINTSKIAIELNKNILKKEKLNEFLLKENDKLEIIRFMPGG